MTDKTRDKKIEEHYLGLAEVCTLAEMIELIENDVYACQEPGNKALEAYKLLQKARLLLGDMRRE